MSSKLLVFLDADVIFAGSAAPTEHGASHVVLRMGEITLLDCVTSQQAVIEAERNLEEKLPSKLAEFRLIVNRSLRVIADPKTNELTTYAPYAHPEDLPLLVAALREGCPYFLTFNVRHYRPRGLPIQVLRPGDFLQTVREQLIALAVGRAE
ncbi:MAG: hypothetical protein HDKAJFGB_03768 [Anaerolineae bacterium]|nr:hypothetical protein [Anaerolineae bacterium]